MRKIWIAGITTSFTLVGFSAPAFAEVVPNSTLTSCASWQSHSVALPGKPDVTLSARPCILVNDDHQKAEIQWKQHSDSVGPGTRWDEVYVHVNLEHDDNGYSPTNCYITSDLNDADNDVSGTCAMGWKSYNNSWYYTSDGLIEYDINNAGKDEYYWNLHGSPSLKS
jgi:hypothetical protein